MEISGLSGSVEPYLAKAIEVLSNRETPKSAKSCLAKRCTCCCHSTWKRARRFWSLEGTSLLPLWKLCNKPGCNSRRLKQSSWFALSQFGLPFAIKAQLELRWGHCGVSVRPSLEFPIIERYTSPAFMLLAEARHDIRPWREAREELQRMFEEGSASPKALDPNGDGWIDVFP